MSHPPVFRPSIVLPTYNNPRTLAGVLHRTARLALPIYLVDDGSAVPAKAILREQQWGAMNTTLLTHATNHGKGQALRTGFAAAAADGHTHAATIDTDGQLDPEDIPALLQAAQAHPRALVLGTRQAGGTGCPARCALGRRIANLLIRLETGLYLADTQCGLRVYPLNLFDQTPTRSGGFEFETEVIVRAAWAGRPIIEAPVRSRYLPPAERVSHWKPWRETPRGARLHARLLWERLRATGPLRATASPPLWAASRAPPPASEPLSGVGLNPCNPAKPLNPPLPPRTPAPQSAHPAAPASAHDPAAP